MAVMGDEEVPSKNGKRNGDVGERESTAVIPVMRGVEVVHGEEEDEEVSRREKR